MPEEQTPETTTTTQGETPAEATDVKALPEWAQKLITDTRAESANYRTQLRAAEPIVKAHSEAQEASKTEAEKLKEQIAAVTAERDQAAQALLRAQVASERGLTPAQAKRLSGTTVEELTADADDLLSAFGPAEGGGEPSAPPGQRPRETNLRGGRDPGAETVELDPAKLAAGLELHGF